jgi:hypothetical protein
MVWIFAVLVWFLLTVLRGYRERFAFGALITGLVAVALLNVLNPDALIVRTNIARIETGKEFDAPYLASLSADAIPSLLDSLPDMNEDDRRAVEDELHGRWASPTEGDWRTYNLSRARARYLIDAETFAGEPELAGARASFGWPPAA